MSERAPLVTAISRVVPNAAQAADASTPIGVAPFDGAVTAVQYIPDTAITGADTNTRTISLVNRGDDGTGTTVIATLTFEDGTDGAAFDAVTVPLSEVEDATAVAEGDVLEWLSEDVGDGLADPGGLVQLSIARS